MSMITDPTALADQFHAASREARNLLRRAATVGGTAVDTSEPTPWLAAQIEAVKASIMDETVRMCEHLLAAPGIAVVTIWRPGVMACGRCADALLTAGPVEQSTCDRCRRIVALIHPCAATFGPFLLTYGLCPTCYHQENPTAPQLKVHPGAPRKAPGSHTRRPAPGRPRHRKTR